MPSQLMASSRILLSFTYNLYTNALKAFVNSSGHNSQNHCFDLNLQSSRSTSNDVNILCIAGASALEICWYIVLHISKQQLRILLLSPHRQQQDDDVCLNIYASAPSLSDGLSFEFHTRTSSHSVVRGKVTLGRTTCTCPQSWPPPPSWPLS